jgi:hypothetical protein
MLGNVYKYLFKNTCIQIRRWNYDKKEAMIRIGFLKQKSKKKLSLFYFFIALFNVTTLEKLSLYLSPLSFDNRVLIRFFI